jgi:hypothetical protein
MPDIRHVVEIDANAEQIYMLVATGKGFTRWWAEDIVIDATEGIADVGFYNRTTVYRLHPERMKAPRKAEWVCVSPSEWGGTKLIFDINPGDGGSILYFSHAYWKQESELFVRCNTIWGELMFRLKAAAEGKMPGPLFSTGGLVYPPAGEPRRPSTTAPAPPTGSPAKKR